MSLRGGVYVSSLHSKTILNPHSIQHHARQYPTLSRMARDYLPIQGSATASERAFSSGGLTGTARRNRLNVCLFEALQLLKSAYRNDTFTAPAPVGDDQDDDSV
jgi:hypothetical protein